MKASQPASPKSADPRVRRVESLGKRTEGNLCLRKLGNLVLGDWGLGLQGVPIGPLGPAELLLFPRFPALSLQGVPGLGMRHLCQLRVAEPGP